VTAAADDARGLTSVAQDYLKVIWNAQEWSGEKVSTKMLSERIGVSASTASESIRKLAEQGLVEHAKYGAVTLTERGRRAAVSVVRRHRLLEAFLVQMLGYRWDEVHDEAEVLEHAVSDLLLSRIDAKLGHPKRDPHGDPIPTAEGTITPRHLENLLTCSTGIPLTVTRITDQDPAFLRFVEENNLKPGQAIEVEARDTAADSVRLRGTGREPITIGTRAASKLLVETVKS